MNRSMQHQDFQILAAPGTCIDACAQFLFHGYMISMSTLGYSHGGCLNEIAVMADDGNGRIVYTTTSVQKAIHWVFSQLS